VATHNHFVLDRGGKVFKQSAPVIKLPEGATEDDHLRLLGVLNSSTACFWLKQVCHDKGNGGYGGGIADQEWERFFELTGTNLERFPLPAELPLDLPRRLDALAQRLAATTPAAVCAAGTPTRAILDLARRGWEGIRGQMIALQEELDWRVYRLYGLLREDLTYLHDDLPPLALGERAFEIVLARRVARGEEETAWFERHGSTPITEAPGHWPAAYRELVERRIAAIEERRDIALIERPECKRRWATDPWPDQERRALRAWLLDRLERERLWSDPQGRPRARSVAQLAGDLAHDAEFQDVLALYAGSRDCDLATELGRLLDEESVPFLGACRYTDAGLRKRADWERVWELQRREDAGDEVGRIPVPPRYAQADFARASYWRWRGKLDVPKERFIAYPGAERDGDRSPVYGWAGWDHLRQAQAIATLVLDRSHRDGWTAERLTPLLAGLAELEPWLRQWHAAPDPAYSGPPADYMAAFLDAQLAEHGLTRQQLAAWRPERRRGPGGGRRRAKGTVAAAAPALETTA
jgi:hypothetical protein